MRATTFPSAPFQPASYPMRARPRMEPVRILGYSGAIAINTIAAGLLLMPLQMPPAVAPPEPQPTWIIPATPTPPVLPPPIEKLQPRIETPRTVIPATNVPIPPVQAPVIVFEEGSMPTMTPIEIFVAPSTAVRQADPGPAPAQLEYAMAPPPPYPREALRNGNEGVVMLQVLVDVDGRPLDVEIVDGSGHRALDQAARRHVLSHWRFQPAMRDGQPVQAIGLVPIEFSLD